MIKDIELMLARHKDNGDATVGFLYKDWEFYCHTLEDEHREVKVNGETRIPAGVYEIKARKVLSGLTKTYRKRFEWFDWHLELQDVPGFNYVYIHVGNSEKDTDACILVGKWDEGEALYITDSVDTFKPLYIELRLALKKDKKVTIVIKDE